MTSGRPPLDHRRGSWFAQHGGTRLRFGGVHGTGAALGSGSTGSSPSETRARSLTGKGSRLPQSSDVSDALDELLAHARATLSQLDALRGHSMRGQASGSDSKEASQNLRGGKIPVAQARRPARDEKPGFWRPRCQAHLWRGATEDYTNDSLFDSDEDLESTDSEGSESQWDFIRRNMPSQPQPTGDPQAARRAAMPKFRPFAPGAASARPEASSERSQSKPPSSTTSSPSAGGKEQFGSKGSKAASGTAAGPGGSQKEGKGTPGASSGPSRAHTAGFRFGGQGCSQAAKAMLVPPALAGPEAEVRSALEAAISSGGADGCRQVLKRMLLRWHPDKALQGESAEAKAAQAESTRVLRFILQERDRLGL